MIEEIKALKVAADEVLVLHFREDTTFGMEDEGAWDALTDAIVAAGLEGRCIVMTADVEMAVVKK